MIVFELDRKHRILTVSPQGPLSEDDFRHVAEAVDPLILESGSLAGIAIRADHFPGWRSFAALLGHFRFVRDHHRHVRRLAVVSDSAALTILPQIANHFVAAEVRHFAYNDYVGALAWIGMPEQGHNQEQTGA